MTALTAATGARHERAHLVVVCEPGSYAEHQVGALARQAEQTLEQILRRLGLSTAVLDRPRKLTIRAGDAIRDPERPDRVLAEGSASDLAEEVVSTVYRPDSRGIDLTEHLARVVLHRAVAAGPGPARRDGAGTGGAEVQRFFVEGVARYLAHQLTPSPRRQVNPATLAAEQRCYDAASRNEWKLPLYQALLRGPTPEVDPDLHAAMQEAFGAYVFERDGAREFLRFLAGARIDPNYSAEIVYGESLELLEAEWLRGLRRGIGRKLVSLPEFLRQVWPYLKRYPWRQVEGLALMLITSISGAVTPFQFRNLIDLLGAEQTRADPWGHGLTQALYILAVMTTAILVANFAGARLVYVVAVLGQNILRDIRLTYIDRVNGFGAGYFARMRSGDLMARFVSDILRLAEPIARITAYGTYYLILIAVTLVSLIVMSWQLTLVLLLLLPMYFVIVRRLGPAIQRASRGRQERLAQINSHIGELIYAHPMVQIFNLQRHLHRRMRPEIHEFRRVEIRADFLRGIFNEITDIADILLVRLTMLCGAVLVLASYDPEVQSAIGSASIGTLVGFFALTGRFITPLDRLSDIYGGVAYAGAALRRVEEVLHQPAEDMAVPPNGTAEPPAVREGISIERVDFAYGTEPVLRDVSVRIPAGTSAAFVGPTGAGKTTLVSMIPRFYEPTTGSVRIDGRDVREHALPALRSRIALVSQETFLFNTTIRENIQMGKLGATDDEIVDAARAARVHDFIMTLPAGYDTIVGERGTRLSGGQRQRLAIARALLRDAPILILDEATSALDAETEQEILEELAEATRGKTTISITHRLALAMRADRIYVLDRGRIVDSGTHAELLARDGLYKKLFEDQNQLLLGNGSNGAGANGTAARSATAEPTAS